MPFATGQMEYLASFLLLDSLLLHSFLYFQQNASFTRILATATNRATANTSVVTTGSHFGAHKTAYIRHLLTYPCQGKEIGGEVSLSYEDTQRQVENITYLRCIERRVTSSQPTRIINRESKTSSIIFPPITAVHNETHHCHHHHGLGGLVLAHHQQHLAKEQQHQ